MATREYEPNMVLATTQYEVVGTRPLRHDGTDKVTGRALYGADFTAAGLVHGAVLRSPHAHAHIRSIDTSRAEAAPGVLAVVTAEDFPDIDDSADGIVDLGESAIKLAIPQGQRPGQQEGAVQGPADRGGSRSQSTRGPGGAGPDRGRLRGAARGRDRAGGDEGRRSDPARPHEDPGARRADRQGLERIGAHPVRPRRPGQGTGRGRRRDRAGVRYGDGAPGVHRAAERNGVLE